MAIYVVQKGDTIDGIAENFQVEASQIIFDNQIVRPYALAIGQALYIGGSAPLRDTQMRVNGYAYPFIGSYVLGQTLPYLTSLSIFSYGFTEQGELIAPAISDEWMITKARDANVIPVLTLTPFGKDGKFNNNLIHVVVSSEEYSYNLIYNVLYTVENKKFGAVDIDFEYILAEDKDAFTLFVQRMTNVLNNEGYEVSVALAPKTSDTQVGVLVGGKDYQGLGKAANRVLLMTYEYGYKYGPNMAVAPLNQVEKVVQYAVSRIPNEKVNLGIPNYGYDWTLPFVKEKSVATTIGNVEAVQIAIREGAEIFFDEEAQSPFFNYVNDGKVHEVWFEDVRSILAKINLIKKYGLEGAGYWQINQLFRANWLLLDQQTTIQKLL
jgi:spore germination protein